MTEGLAARKVPPQNLEAERAVLGAILLENEAIYTVMEILTPASFYQEAHRIIFDNMLSLSEKGKPIDLITLSDRLRSEGILDKIGGASYLPSMVEDIPTSAGVGHYARIVKDKSILRDMISTTGDILEDCYHSPGEVEDLLDNAERRIFQISEKRVRSGFFSLREIVKSSFKTIESLYERKEHLTGVPTGFSDIDEITSGMQSSDLIIVAGRPSMGKTAFCLNIAQNLAVDNKYPVAIFSLEMAKEQLVTRMLCSQARIDAHRLRSGYLGKNRLAETHPGGRPAFRSSDLH